MALRNWAGNVTFTATRLHEPESVAQLQELVAATPTLRALGSGHSFSRIADSAGELVSVARLRDVPIEIDDAAAVVRVGGGVRYAELAAALQASGRALPNLGSLPHIAVAGACATGTHGSGDTNRCLATSAVAIEFVRADGELITVRAGDPDFPGSVLALGALGIVTRMSLAVVASFELRQDVWLDAPLDTVVDKLGDILAAGYSVSLFTDWQRRGIVDKIWVKSPADADPMDGRAWGAVPADAPQHPITGEDTAAATEQLGAVGPWHERIPHFRAEFRPSSGAEQQSEYLVPRELGAAAVEAISRVAYGGALQVCEIRSVAPDELWLSPCHDRPTVALHFTWVADDAAVRPAVAALEQALAPFDARPHWGKVFGLPAEQVRAHYPKLADFRALAARHDPQRRFGNEFLERYVF